LEKKNVIHIACGLTFNMVLTDEFKLYGWGNNESGQISPDNTSFSFTTVHQTLQIIDHRTSNLTHSMFSCYPSNSKESAFNYNATSNSVQSQKHYVYPREITIISSEISKFFF